MRTLLLGLPLLLLLLPAARAGDAAPPALARLAKAETLDAREAAGEELLAAGVAVEPHLLAALSKLHPEAAAVALGVLAELDSPGAPAALLRAAAAPEEPRRRAAAYHLPRHVRMPEAVEALVRLCGDPSDEVALAAAGGLRATRPPGAFDGLVDLVGRAEDPPRPPTRVAAEALGGLFAAGATEAGVERLLAAARTASDAGRRLLLEALAGGGPPAAEALLGLLEAGLGVELLDAEARGRVLDQLGELADAVTDEALALALRGLGRLAEADPRAVPAMARALAHRSPRVRAAGLQGLVVPAASADRAARHEALRRLAELLVDPDDGLRRAAHARLVRETGEALPLSQPAWSRWLAAELAAAAASPASPAEEEAP